MSVCVLPQFTLADQVDKHFVLGKLKRLPARRRQPSLLHAGRRGVEHMQAMIFRNFQEGVLDLIFTVLVDHSADGLYLFLVEFLDLRMKDQADRVAFLPIHALLDFLDGFTENRSQSLAVGFWHDRLRGIRDDVATVSGEDGGDAHDPLIVGTALVPDIRTADTDYEFVRESRRGFEKPRDAAHLRVAGQCHIVERVPKRIIGLRKKLYREILHRNLMQEEKALAEIVRILRDLELLEGLPNLHESQVPAPTIIRFLPDRGLDGVLVCV